MAAPQLSSTVQGRVNAVVMFGDPDNGQALPGVLNGRKITFCATGDDICAGGQVINAAHLSYGAVSSSKMRNFEDNKTDLNLQDAGQAASFVASHV